MRSVTRVAPGDLYRLRRLNLYAEKKALEAQRAQNLVREAVPDKVGVKYGPEFGSGLGVAASLDSHSGLITRAEEVSNEPRGNEGAGPQGPA